MTGSVLGILSEVLVPKNIHRTSVKKNPEVS